MTNAQAKPKQSFYQIALPASGLLLAGLSLFYSLRSEGTVTTFPPAQASAPLAIADLASANNQSDISDAAYSRLGGLAARGNGNAAGYSKAITDPAAALAQLHASLNPVHAKQDRDRMVADLDNEHQAEPVDATWSAQSEVKIMSAAIAPVVLQAGFKPQDVATDCRSRTCKISARFTSAGDAEDWGDRVVTQMGTTLSQVKTTVIQLPDGSSEIRMYGARKQPSRG